MSNKKIDNLQNKINDRPAQTKEPLPKIIVVADLSEGSQEVLEFFGVEAPTLLNDFSCALEDALIESGERYKALKQKYEALKSKYE